MFVCSYLLILLVKRAHALQKMHVQIKILHIIIETLRGIFIAFAVFVFIDSKYMQVLVDRRLSCTMLLLEPACSIYPFDLEN